MIKNKCLLVLFLVFITSVSTFAQNFSKPETRGVWVTQSYLRAGSWAIEEWIQKLSDANFNTIYLGVWSRGYTIYPSEVVRDAGGSLQDPDFEGTDPLKTTIEIAHKYGMQVFAWFEYGFSVGFTYSVTDIPGIIKLHPDWAMVQRDTAINYYPEYNGYFWWIDPAVDGVDSFMVALHSECAKNYPDLDGIELDRMRYPTTNFSYSDSSRKKFMMETKNPDPLTLNNNDREWSSWRRLQVSNVVKNIYKGVKKVNPECVVTGAVVPPYMMYGASDDKLQAWDVWANSNYVDMLEPMLYLPTSSFGTQLDLCENYISPGFQISPGIAISSAGSVNNLVSEIKDARKRNIAGVTIWYYGDLLAYSDAFIDIRFKVFITKTNPAYNDLYISNRNPGTFRYTGNWTQQDGGYDGTYMLAKAVQGDTAIFMVRVLRSGDYNLYGYWSGDESTNSANAIIQTSTNNFSKSDTINQQLNLNLWSYIDKFYLNYGDTVTIKLFGTDGNNLVADAFRLMRDTSSITGIGSVINSTPQKFELGNNYPNPFNPITTIKYSIRALTPSLSHWERVSEGQVRVELKVYDILGREVATLVNENKSAGNYEVKFDASNLASGVYFYRLQADNFTSTKKMILLR